MKKDEKKTDRLDYIKDYQKENYYRMTVLMPKEMRARIEEEAEKSGESKNGYVVKAIQDRLGE